MMIHPIDKVYITQTFGGNADMYRKFGLAGHNGIDYRVRFADSLSGKRPIRAALDGVVLEATTQGKSGYGGYVRLRHEGSSQTIYGHLSKWLPKVGQEVKQGEIIGISGGMASDPNSGYSTGAHLHFGYRPDKWETELINNGFKGWVDPLPYIEGKLPLPSATVDDDFAKKWAGWLIIVPELKGEVWYINPKTLKRYKLSGGVTSADAAILARDGAWVGMTVKDLMQIPIA